MLGLSRDCPLTAVRSYPGLVYSRWQIPLEETPDPPALSPAEPPSLLIIAGAGPAAVVQITGGELA